MEVEVKNLRESVDSLKEDVADTNAKLDQLLSLKQQGMGAVYFASVIFGSSILGAISWLAGWLKP